MPVSPRVLAMYPFIRRSMLVEPWMVLLEVSICSKRRVSAKIDFKRVDIMSRPKQILWIYRRAQRLGPGTL